MQEEDKFKYLGMAISADGVIVEEVAHKVLEGRKVWGITEKLWKENMAFREVRRELHEGVVIPTVVYDSETWSLTHGRRQKQKYLRNKYGMTRVEKD